MSLLHRLRDVIEEKANAQLGRAENPEEALDLSYEKLLDNLQQARRAVADALTAEKRLDFRPTSSARIMPGSMTRHAVPSRLAGRTSPGWH